MEAMARVIREKLAPRDVDPRVVFVGPCVAKKDEAQRSSLVDAVLTFRELDQLFQLRGVNPDAAPERDFDPPHANLGKIYPVTGGLLKAAAIEDDLLESPVTVVEGKERVADLLHVLTKQVQSGQTVSTRFFDLLFCEGCIAGPVMPNDLTFYERKKYIVAQMKKRPLVTDIGEWAAGHEEYLDVDLSKGFQAAKMTEEEVPEEEIRKILAQTGKLRPEDELNCRACGYNSCRDKAIAVHRGIAEVEMCLPHLISQMEQAIDEIKTNQTRLIQAEKLASMGQMAAGIAHEINNPLGVVLMYAHLLKEELEDQEEKPPGLADVVRIIDEAERTRGIVKGILNFAREEKINRAPADINQLLKEAAAAVEALIPNGSIQTSLVLDKSMGPHNVDAHQLRQVFDNIIKNAVEVMREGGELTIESVEGAGEFKVLISDTGPGIPEEHFPKLFSPFFTTKPIGKGTGLGLPVCYGIVKMHGGAIRAINREEGGARFEVTVRDGNPSSEGAA
jgi:signal transduction histidine kinase